MSRIPRDILERLGYFQREVDELFRRLFVDDPSPGTLSAEPAFPPLDVVEGEHGLMVRADLPGVDRDDIELYGAPDFLIIRGSKPAVSEKFRYLRLERTFGNFQRLITLPVPGDTARMSARFDKGVLEIRVPKLVDRRVRHRQIPIE